MQTEITQKFTAISAEENAQAFSQFLARLLASCNAQDDKFKPLVAEWLTRLSAAPELRAATFAAAIIAVESCEDRVALAWNEMQQAELICRIKAGEYDNQWPELVAAGRVMFRLQQLELIAREKVKTLRFIDEIEVYLAFQTALSTRLQLTGFAKEMRFYEHAGISEAELKAAALRVKTAENTEFAPWFALWEPWHSILQRNHPDLWAAADQQRRQHYPDDYEHRLNTRLQDISISANDEDAKRNLGREVMQEIDREIFVPLTESSLEESQFRLLSTNTWTI
ncbi:NEL-type E3 ubiquitin ligase domain-containing protein [Pantoea cypripedii]|uniref:NEL-type E3 ubiquitin ligase domain-containing protein n=1 Tax=Pantoea cypripedii TaxID=55209 RepID=UPI002FC826A5